MVQLAPRVTVRQTNIGIQLRTLRGSSQNREIRADAYGNTAAVNLGYSFNYSIAALPKRSLSKLLLVTIREHPPPREMPDLSIRPWVNSNGLKWQSLEPWCGGSRGHEGYKNSSPPDTDSVSLTVAGSCGIKERHPYCQYCSAIVLSEFCISASQRTMLTYVSVFNTNEWKIKQIENTK